MRKNSRSFNFAGFTEPTKTQDNMILSVGVTERMSRYYIAHNFLAGMSFHQLFGACIVHVGDNLKDKP